MLNPIDFIQLGVAGVAVIVIAYIVDKFLKSQSRRDDSFMNFIQTQEKNFKETIDNHLKEETKSNYYFANTVKELMAYLKGQNNKKCDKIK